MNLYNLASFRKKLYNIFYNVVYQSETKEIELKKLMLEFKRCGGDMRLLQQYLNILFMYSKTAARELIINPTLLITIDTDDKILAWILRQYDIKNVDEFSCDLIKFMI